MLYIIQYEIEISYDMHTVTHRSEVNYETRKTARAVETPTTHKFSNKYDIQIHM